MIPIDLKISAEGVFLPVQAQAGARRNQIVGVHDGRLKVAVTQIPERGKANQEIQKLLAAAFGLPKSRVSLRSGLTSPLKVFCLQGLGLAEVQDQLSQLLK